MTVLQLLQDVWSVSDHFGTLSMKGLSDCYFLRDSFIDDSSHSPEELRGHLNAPLRVEKVKFKMLLANLLLISKSDQATTRVMQETAFSLLPVFIRCFNWFIISFAVSYFQSPNFKSVWFDFCESYFKFEQNDLEWPSGQAGFTSKLNFLSFCD